MKLPSIVRNLIFDLNSIIFKISFNLVQSKSVRLLKGYMGPYSLKVDSETRRIFLELHEILKNYSILTIF